MNIWHKRALYLQILLLVTVVVLLIFFPGLFLLGKIVLVISFLLAEFAVLEFQRTENPAAVYYRKSCVFAMVDLLSVFIFGAVGILKMTCLVWDYDFWLNPIILIILFSYIALRKLYILKNYSYEK